MPTAQDIMDMNALLKDGRMAGWLLEYLLISIEKFIKKDDPKAYYRGIKEVIGEGGFSVV